MDVGRGHPQEIGKGRPLALHRGPYEDVHRTSFGDVIGHPRDVILLSGEDQKKIRELGRLN